MSGLSVIAFFGLRFRVDSEHDIEALENRRHLHQRFANSVKLDHYWANFDEPGELFYSFLGRRLGILGSENQNEISITSSDFDKIQSDVKEKLRSLGIEEVPQIFLQLLPDA